MITLADGARLATWTSGSPSPHAPVVLIHGGPGLWDYLEPLAAMIDDLAVVHRYDQRGCGRSGPSDDLSLERYLADLDELLDHWGHDRATLIGHSFGAAVALAYAATRPEQVAAVGYVSGVGVGDWRTPNRAARARALGPDRLARLAALGDRDRTAAEETEWRTLQWLPDYADPALGERESRAMAATPLPINLDANRRVSFTDERARAWAAAVECPVTVVHGSADTRPLACAAALADLVPHARKRVLQGVGHMVFAEAPDEFADLAREIVVSA